ncbi:hypothetical protein H2198_010632 [Neophaeococcomyces mojaviensis]|uniref:Uncharacterized protein n=1 Tax=Neophaeococcomyces mojaviensis TaxID=3383035 RepID=A0ACC2ZR49_9EURO|nr:hypothetical protein H2198_010632 [Knufia sp. JES_112]
MASTPTPMTHLSECQLPQHQMCSSISSVLEIPYARDEYTSRTHLLSDQPPLRFSRHEQRNHRLSFESDVSTSEHSFISYDTENTLAAEQEPEQQDSTFMVQQRQPLKHKWNGRLHKVLSGLALVQRPLSICSMAASMREHINTNHELQAQRHPSNVLIATTSDGTETGNSTRNNSVLSGSTISNSLNRVSSATTSSSIHSGPTLGWNEKSRTSTKFSKEFDNAAGIRNSLALKLRSRLSGERKMNFLKLAECDSEKQAKKDAKKAKKERRKKQREEWFTRVGSDCNYGYGSAYDETSLVDWRCIIGMIV